MCVYGGGRMEGGFRGCLSGPIALLWLCGALALPLPFPLMPPPPLACPLSLAAPTEKRNETTTTEGTSERAACRRLEGGGACCGFVHGLPGVLRAQRQCFAYDARERGGLKERQQQRPPKHHVKCESPPKQRKKATP